MQAGQQEILNLNGAQYNVSQLSTQGQRLLLLLKEAQNEIGRLDIRLQLLQASQQHLVSLLTPLLPEPIQQTSTQKSKVRGEASETIPSTPAAPPAEQPAAFPENLPETFRAEQ